MRERDAATPREREVWARLDLVMDPELDEPVTEMGFVEAVAVDEGGGVDVLFRLPTYWCSPNFAFLMAEGIRREAGALPWATAVRVRLEDHLCADEMNEAVNAGRDFAAAFAARAEGGALDAVREKFEVKAFQRRQEAVLMGLRAMGLKPVDLAAMTLNDLDAVRFDEPEAARQAPRYRALLAARGLSRGPGDHAFPDADGRPLTAEGYVARMSELRGVRINMEFGAVLCRGLKESRYKEAPPPCDGEPTLRDFILGRAPAPVRIPAGAAAPG